MLDSVRGRLQATHSSLVLAGLGSFAGAIRIPAGMRDPVLALSTDSVGTKVGLAATHNRLGSVGHDLVNHCANDILAIGAEPLAFVDYIAHSDLAPAMLADAVGGLADACGAIGTSVVGGETAQLPGVYRSGQLDLVGTILGVVEAGSLIDGTRVAAGDDIVALPSNGIHTNGYSLATKVLADFDLAAHNRQVGRPLIDELLAVHRCYVNDVIPHRAHIHALAHITGGGIEANTARVIPAGLCAQFGWGTWQVPPIFHLIQEAGKIEFGELAQVFNLGIGMAVIGPRPLSDRLVRSIPGATLVGQVIADESPQRARILR